MSYGLFGCIRNDRVERVDGTMRIVVASESRRILEIVLRQIRKQRARERVEFVFVGRYEVRDAAARGVRRRSAKFFERDVFAGDRLDDLGSGDEHLRDLVGHDHEIGDRRRVDGAAGARPGDQADLRHHAARGDVAPEDFRVAPERHDALLNARAARIVDTDHRCAGAHRQIHHLADFFGVGFAQRSAEHREVLREEEDLAAVDRRASRHDAVAEKLLFVESERVRTVHDEPVELRRASRGRSAPPRVRSRCAFRARAAFRRPHGLPEPRSAGVFGRVRRTSRASSSSSCVCTAPRAHPPRARRAEAPANRRRTIRVPFSRRRSQEVSCCVG